MIEQNVRLRFDAELCAEGVNIIFEDDQHFISWRTLIVNEVLFLASDIEGEVYKFKRIDYDEFDQIAEGLIDAGAEMKRILAQSVIDD